MPPAIIASPVSQLQGDVPFDDRARDAAQPEIDGEPHADRPASDDQDLVAPPPVHARGIVALAGVLSERQSAAEVP